MRQKFRSITQFLRLPAICNLCHQFHEAREALCQKCLAFIQPLCHSCQSCAVPLPAGSHPFCGDCIQKPPYFDKGLIPYPYEEPLRTLLHQFKYQKGLYLASSLSRLMGRNYAESSPKPQCLIPIPMHPQRLRERGFNHAVMLTQLLAKQWQLPYQLNNCQKIINTPAQASLDAKARKRNLNKAFLAKPLPYHHIALVDDLLTTGSTANAVARAFKKVGVKQVDIWCCARTLYRNR